MIQGFLGWVGQGTKAIQGEGEGNELAVYTLVYSPYTKVDTRIHPRLPVIYRRVQAVYTPYTGRIPG
jgi:hypothetical protein